MPSTWICDISHQHLMVSSRNDNLLRHLICAQFTEFMKMVKFDFMFSKGPEPSGLCIQFSYLL